MKRHTQRAKVTPELYPTVEVTARRGNKLAGEDVRGADGMLIYPGRTVRRPPIFSESLGVVVSEAFGKVQRLYRQPGRERVVVQTENGHFFWADQVVRSRAGEAAVAEKSRREAA